MEYKLLTSSEEETMVIAENIESEKFENMVICLIGDLGSGKTVFTKGFAAALAIEDTITSPTFNVIKEYTSGQLPLYHMDFYRLEGDIKELGIEEYFKKKGIVIIEWADLIEKHLPRQRLEIRFMIVDEERRLLIIKPYGKKYEELCEAVL
ncbi:MAG TPA: tRNA (adenosine(37)-N6)-threonylcarbamoyltransferase complex ATPase subunit type 1 TsaE [Bacilli bacterium]|nr:tRNA (adenosine(37)-N6)-threonylcarbamoyltransferase complex ATPase subunit type 1 TsaE [Bacilli bacterium]